MRIGIIGAAIAMLGVAAPASARWHGTEWGMTKAQVRAAIKAPLAAGDAGTRYAITGADEPSDDVLKGRVVVLGQAMDAVLGFDAAGKLFAVELYVVEPAGCDALLARLRKIYGSRGGYGYMGDSAPQSRWFDWTDPAGSTRIHFLGNGWTPPSASGGDGSFQGCSVGLSRTKPQPASDW